MFNIRKRRQYRTERFYCPDRELFNNPPHPRKTVPSRTAAPQARELYAARAPPRIMRPRPRSQTRSGERGGSMSSEGSHVGARVSDADLIDSLDMAADEMGSRSEAVRHAIRETYGSDGDGDGDGVDGDLGELPDEARAGYRALRDHFGTDRMIEVGAAKSVIAERERIPKTSIRSVVFEPLRRSGHLTVTTKVTAAFVTVRGESA